MSIKDDQNSNNKKAAKRKPEDMDVDRAGPVLEGLEKDSALHRLYRRLQRSADVCRYVQTQNSMFNFHQTVHTTSTVCYEPFIFRKTKRQRLFRQTGTASNELNIPAGLPVIAEEAEQPPKDENQVENITNALGDKLKIGQ